MTTPESFYKMVTMFLAGVVLTLIGAYFAAQKNVVTKEDLAIQLTNQQQQIISLQQTTTALNVSVTQLDIDVARIADRLDVTARPVPPKEH